MLENIVVFVPYDQVDKTIEQLLIERQEELFLPERIHVILDHPGTLNVPRKGTLILVAPTGLDVEARVRRKVSSSM